MTAGIVTHFRIATDAVRRCAYLRRETAALRAPANTVRAVKAAGARFPSPVFGGELLSLMSTQFRDLLEQPSGRRVASYGREAPREFATSPMSERTGAAWTETMRENSASATFEPARTNSARASVPPHGSPLASLSDAMPDSSSRREYLTSGDAFQYSFPGAPPLGGKLGRAEPASLLAKKLREYWELERRGAISHSAAIPALEPRPGQKGRAEKAESRPAAAATVRFGQTTFAQRLHTFVSGDEPREHTGRAPWREAAESAPDVPGLRTISQLTAGTALAGDFAVRLADTLHVQAIQHGIDLT